MSGGGNGSGEQLAEWLKEAGRRTQSAAREASDASDDTFNSPASLHKYLEDLAGRKLQTHADVLAYLRQVAGTQPDAHRERERRRMVREVSLLALLAVSYLHFYYWEVQLEIAALRSVGVFIPAPEARPHKITA
ncbi:MAG: hypothetical protein OEV81_14490 [Betaproteobacteria bacterium]|nr:hypothetical protein [Betaproteobacteria bacterium]MDH5220764.1 hypothetical protein [Betaproteobacteria bacterium]MDH5352170.1 hypothetical protein [Betaproteobacteria bacterium]